MVASTTRDDGAVCQAAEQRATGVPSVGVHSGVAGTLAGSAYADCRAECERFARALGVTSLRDVTRGQALGHARARHVVAENERVHQTAAALRAGNLERVGELFSESHASLRDDFEVSSEALDAIVAAAQGADGCYGARLTGAGFAGCAVALVDEAAAEGFGRDVSTTYARSTGRTCTMYVCRASDGASATTL